MATSNSTDFTVDRDTIITEALEICGVLAEGESPSANQITSCSRTLNLLVKALIPDGLHLWKRVQGDITITKGAPSYTCGTGGTGLSERPVRLVDAWVTSGGTDIPVELISDERYNALSTKDDVGEPLEAYYDPQLGTGTIYVWPTGSGTSGETLHVVYHALIQDFDASTDTPDFPQEWHECLVWGLASRLAQKYGVSTAEKNYIATLYTQMRSEVESFDSEFTSLYIQPEEQYGTSS